MTDQEEQFVEMIKQMELNIIAKFLCDYYQRQPTQRDIDSLGMRAVEPGNEMNIDMYVCIDGIIMGVLKHEVLEGFAVKVYFLDTSKCN